MISKPMSRLAKVMVPLVIASGIAAPVLAEGPAGPPLDAEAFDAFVTGQTLTYGRNGQIYGIEEYLPDRKVRWQFTQDRCEYGEWYQSGAEICFVYEISPGEHCWLFWQNGDTLTAQSSSDLPPEALSEVARSQQGLSCPAPDVGV